MSRCVLGRRARGQRRNPAPGLRTAGRRARRDVLADRKITLTFPDRSDVRRRPGLDHLHAAGGVTRPSATAPAARTVGRESLVSETDNQTTTIVERPSTRSSTSPTATEPRAPTVWSTTLVTLDKTKTVEVDNDTIDGTAVGGQDFTHVGGRLSFQPGDTRQTIYVPSSTTTTRTTARPSA